MISFVVESASCIRFTVRHTDIKSFQTTTECIAMELKEYDWHECSEMISRYRLLIKQQTLKRARRSGTHCCA